MRHPGADHGTFKTYSIVQYALKKIYFKGLRKKSKTRPILKSSVKTFFYRIAPWLPSTSQFCYDLQIMHFVEELYFAVHEKQISL